MIATVPAGRPGQSQSPGRGYSGRPRRSDRKSSGAGAAQIRIAIAHIRDRRIRRNTTAIGDGQGVASRRGYAGPYTACPAAGSGHARRRAAGEERHRPLTSVLIVRLPSGPLSVTATPAIPQAHRGPGCHPHRGPPTPGCRFRWGRVAQEFQIANTSRLPKVLGLPVAEDDTSWYARLKVPFAGIVPMQALALEQRIRAAGAWNSRNRIKRRWLTPSASGLRPKSPSVVSQWNTSRYWSG